MIVCYDITWSNAETKYVLYSAAIWQLWIEVTFDIQSIIHKVL